MMESLLIVTGKKVQVSQQFVVKTALWKAKSIHIPNFDIALIN